MTAYIQIQQLASKLPLPVLEDIDKRCEDWFASGGNENDPYIHQQLRYAKNIIKAKENTL